jgi:hypothetical protein
VLQTEVELSQCGTGLAVDETVADLLQQHDAEQDRHDRGEHEGGRSDADLQRAAPPVNDSARETAQRRDHGGPAL